ncbi:hypothetical protein ElyMa_004832000 [Elysia marginata]|uniref:Uncharacterized protein n=1 Tax=Elysia marginata TaxID=1093978 RepID=A0AAV4INS7_9GAST|nr:hypothetical protein ElyMa_004832000 [Elysia marginata]
MIVEKANTRKVTKVLVVASLVSDLVPGHHNMGFIIGPGCYISRSECTREHHTRPTVWSRRQKSKLDTTHKQADDRSPSLIRHTSRPRNLLAFQTGL